MPPDLGICPHKTHKPNTINVYIPETSLRQTRGVQMKLDGHSASHTLKAVSRIE